MLVARDSMVRFSEWVAVSLGVVCTSDSVAGQVPSCQPLTVKYSFVVTVGTVMCAALKRIM